MSSFSMWSSFSRKVLKKVRLTLSHMVKMRVRALFIAGVHSSAVVSYSGPTGYTTWVERITV